MIFIFIRNFTSLASATRSTTSSTTEFHPIFVTRKMSSQFPNQLFPILVVLVVVVVVVLPMGVSPQKMRPNTRGGARAHQGRSAFRAPKC